MLQIRKQNPGFPSNPSPTPGIVTHPWKAKKEQANRTYLCPTAWSTIEKYPCQSINQLARIPRPCMQQADRQAILQSVTCICLIHQPGQMLRIGLPQASGNKPTPLCVEEGSPSLPNPHQSQGPQAGHVPSHSLVASTQFGKVEVDCRITFLQKIRGNQTLLASSCVLGLIFSHFILTITPQGCCHYSHLQMRRVREAEQLYMVIQRSSRWQSNDLNQVVPGIQSHGLTSMYQYVDKLTTYQYVDKHSQKQETFWGLPQGPPAQAAPVLPQLSPSSSNNYKISAMSVQNKLLFFKKCA